MKNFKSFKQFSLFAVIVTLMLTSCTRFSPTEAGFFVKNSGSYRGVDSIPLQTGWNFYMPGVSSPISIPTTINHVVWSEDNQEGSKPDQQINVSCMGGSGFKIDVGLNFRVNPAKASKIWLKYKTDNVESITETFLRNSVRGAMQDVSGYMTVDSLLNSLPGYEAAVRRKIDSVFTKEGFVLDNFNVLSRPRPIDPELEKAINAKIQAKQNAERVKMEEQSSIAQANKDIAKAKGDSASAVIRASGEARAISLKQQALSSSPQYVELMKAEKWDGKLPTYMLSGVTPFMSIK